jgi:hypothetical protein
MKYCDQANCPHFQGGDIDGEDCALGFKVKFRIPKSMSDIYPETNWGIFNA